MSKDEDLHHSLMYNLDNDIEMNMERAKKKKGKQATNLYNSGNWCTPAIV